MAPQLPLQIHTNPSCFEYPSKPWALSCWARDARAIALSCSSMKLKNTGLKRTRLKSPRQKAVLGGAVISSQISKDVHIFSQASWTVAWWVWQVWTRSFASVAGFRLKRGGKILVRTDLHFRIFQMRQHLTSQLVKAFCNCLSMPHHVSQYHDGNWKHLTTFLLITSYNIFQLAARLLPLAPTFRGPEIQ